MSRFGKISSIPQSVEALPREIVLLLPAIHALTGCDVTSKVGTKKNAVKATQKITHHGLLRFGFDDLNEEMIASAESFLIDCLPVSTKGTTKFDLVRHSEYHKSKLIDISRLFPCTSTTLRNHIKRAYLETYILTHAATTPDNLLDESLYGYARDYNGYVPVMDPDVQSTPHDFN